MSDSYYTTMIFYTKSGGRKRKSFLSPLFAVLLWVVSQPPFFLTQESPAKPPLTLSGEGIMISTNNNIKNARIIDGIVSISPASHSLLEVKRENAYTLTSEFRSGTVTYKLDLKNIQSLSENHSSPVAYASTRDMAKNKSALFQGWATLSKNNIVVTKMAPVLLEVISRGKHSVLIMNIEEPSNTNHVIVLETGKTN